MPKCEIFDLFDFNDFYVIKSLKVGNLKINFFRYGPFYQRFLTLS